MNLPVAKHFTAFRGNFVFSSSSLPEKDAYLLVKQIPLLVRHRAMTITFVSDRMVTRRDLSNSFWRLEQRMGKRLFDCRDERDNHQRTIYANTLCPNVLSGAKASERNLQ